MQTQTLSPAPPRKGGTSKGHQNKGDQAGQLEMADLGVAGLLIHDQIERLQGAEGRQLILHLHKHAAVTHIRALPATSQHTKASTKAHGCFPL